MKTKRPRYKVAKKKVRMLGGILEASIDGLMGRQWARCDNLRSAGEMIVDLMRETDRLRWMLHQFDETIGGTHFSDIAERSQRG